MDRTVDAVTEPVSAFGSADIRPPVAIEPRRRYAMRMACVPLAAAAITLEASSAIAQNQDQARVVFEHALIYGV